MNTIIRLAEDTLMGLIANEEETAYRDETDELAVWCSQINLVLNTKQPKKLKIDLSSMLKRFLVFVLKLILVCLYILFVSLPEGPFLRVRALASGSYGYP